MCGGHNAFVRHSVNERLPDILMSVIAKNDPSKIGPEARSKIEQLAAELRAGKHIIQRIDSSDGGPDWSAYGRDGMNAMETEWWFLENYAYRLLCRILGYFDVSKEQAFDPFAVHKNEALSDGLINLGPCHLVQTSERLHGESFLLKSGQKFRDAVLGSLWGNQADLSHSSGQVVAPITGASKKQRQLVLDESLGCWGASLENHVRIPGVERNSSQPLSICIVLDNCGAELLNDLLLVDFLLETCSECNITLHCKSYPVFVSDALPNDVLAHIAALSKSTSILHRVAHAQVAERLHAARKQDRFRIEQHDFYTSPTPFFQAPRDISEKLCSFDLVITKGDANFRRLIDDRLFPCIASFQQLMHYWGRRTSLLAVRTCKSPVAVGLPTRAVMTRNDPEWLTNGTVGIVAYYFQ